MIFQWENEQTQAVMLRTFLKEQGVSKKLLAKVKFQGGKILVGGREVTVRYLLAPGETVEVQMPAEPPHAYLPPDDTPLAILYEDEHFLAVNKPPLVPSIPSQYHLTRTMANRVRFHLEQIQAKDLVVHVVMRLDRDTSGVILFAKHRFAHALLDTQLRAHQIYKEYRAFAGGNVARLAAHEVIDRPIARKKDSIMARCVDPAGKRAVTEYWLLARNETFAEMRVVLHTGRTHQIRVHFADLMCPLVGDDLYGGDHEFLERQALHCAKLKFYHPFLHKEICIEAPLPEELARFKANQMKSGEKIDGRS